MNTQGKSSSRATARLASRRSLPLDENAGHSSKPPCLSKDASRKKPSVNEDVRRPNSPPLGLGPRASLGSISLNGAPRVLSMPQILGSKDGKPSQTTVEFDGEGNKENIPPFRLGSLSFLNVPRPRRSRAAAASSAYSLVEPTSKSATRQNQYRVIQLLRRGERSDTDEDDPKPFITAPLPRLIRSITSYEKDGKVVLRFGKVIPLSPDTTDTETDSGLETEPISSDSEEEEGSSDSDLSESDTSNGSDEE